MALTIKKKSPRAPSMTLQEAIERVGKVYDADRCHAAPTEGVAKNMGYTGAKNGTALAAMASLRYYGLVERPAEGMLAVTKDFEAYRFAPTETLKRSLVTKWLKSPPLFAELLDKYVEGLPSDATLRFDLIQRGFSPTTAGQCVQVFRRSVDFAHYFEQSPPAEDAEVGEATEADEMPNPGAPDTASSSSGGNLSQSLSKPTTTVADVDRIPVRLAGGRRAWIEIPMPFYEADKERLKKQIDLLLADDENGDGDEQL